MKKFLIVLCITSACGTAAYAADCPHLSGNYGLCSISPATDMFPLASIQLEQQGSQFQITEIMQSGSTSEFKVTANGQPENQSVPPAGGAIAVTTQSSCESDALNVKAVITKGQTVISTERDVFSKSANGIELDVYSEPPGAIPDANPTVVISCAPLAQ